MTPRPVKQKQILKNGLRIRGEKLRTVEYKAKPSPAILCYNCSQYGNTTAFCQNEKTCSQCGLKGHDRKTCPNLDAPPKCPNCGKDHSANSMECALYKKHREWSEAKKVCYEEASHPAANKIDTTRLAACLTEVALHIIRFVRPDLKGDPIKDAAVSDTTADMVAHTVSKHYRRQVTKTEIASFVLHKREKQAAKASYAAVAASSLPPNRAPRQRKVSISSTQCQSRSPSTDCTSSRAKCTAPDTPRRPPAIPPRKSPSNPAQNG